MMKDYRRMVYEGFSPWLTMLIVGVVCFSLVNIAHASETLRLVHSLFRHGDRNPARIFPTDTGNDESTWKEGLGEMTERGIREQYELGKYIRSRYKDFLSSHYDSREIHITSTGFNRTIVSASANVAGMYAPNDDGTKKPLIWQPIPVHSRQKEHDYVLWMDKPCPAVWALYKNKVQKSDQYLKIERENAEFLKYLEEKTGRSHIRLLDMWAIYDSFYCEYQHKDTHKWPEYINQSVYDRMIELHRISTIFYFHLPEIKRLRGGPLFHEIATRMKEKAKNESPYIKRLKYFAYSVHDTTQEALLENLNVYDGAVPTYNQVLFFELHEINQNFVVKLFKRNDSSKEPVEILIPGCQPCYVDRFLELAQLNMPENWYKECELSKENLPQNGPSGKGILVIVAIVVLVLLLIVLAFYSEVRRPPLRISGTPL